MLERLVCILIGYICGLFQTAYIYGKMNSIDIREHGSGNAGTTNALRTLGKKAGAITLAGDILKPIVAMTICFLMFRGSEGGFSFACTMCLYAGAGAVLGHVFPIYLGFRGGKGIATLGGVGIMFSIMAGVWYYVPISLGLFIVIVVLTRYVSLGSLVMLACYYILFTVLGQLGFCKVEAPEIYECYVIWFVLFALAYYKHKANIKRLIDGTENKIGAKKKEAQ